MSSDPDTVGEFALLRMNNMLQRPRMYAETPEELDAVLSILDEIYAAYGNPKPADAKFQRFVDYLREHGYNANTYCSFQRMKNAAISSEELWLGLTAAWKDYMSEFIDRA